MGLFAARGGLGHEAHATTSNSCDRWVARTTTKKADAASRPKEIGPALRVAGRETLLIIKCTSDALMVIANAPNPAGLAILLNRFSKGTVSPLKLLGAALLPTITAGVAFLLL
ncbi:putative Na+/H+ antiporter [Paraburkholderia sp. SIMBA_049]